MTLLTKSHFITFKPVKISRWFFFHSLISDKTSVAQGNITCAKM